MTKRKQIMDTDVQNLFETYENLSLRKLSMTVSLSYPVVLTAAREPIPGQPYNPDEINYEAIAKKLNRKEINLSDYDWAAINEESKRTTTLSKNMDDFKVDTVVYLRKDNTPLKIVYKTETHIVLQPEGSQELLCWGHKTFLLNGPSFTPRVEKTQKVEDEEA